MKPLLTFLAYVICISYTCAQEIKTSALPPAVSDVFSLLYPDARNIEWQIVNGQYRAGFKNNKMATMALLSEDGTLLQTQTQIRTIALPEPTLDFFEEKFAEEKIEMATIIEDEKGIITFTAIVDKADFLFDANGQLLDAQGVVLSTTGKAH
jgi:hypothetical protein